MKVIFRTFLITLIILGIFLIFGIKLNYYAHEYIDDIKVKNELIQSCKDRKSEVGVNNYSDCSKNYDEVRYKNIFGE